MCPTGETNITWSVSGGHARNCVRNHGWGRKGDEWFDTERGRERLSKVVLKEKDGWRRLKKTCMSFDL